MSKRIVTNMKMERTIINKSQRKIADNLGTSQTYLYMLEQAKTIPSRNMKSKMEKLFNKSIEFLLREV